jgi:hypothetical protein
VRIHDHQSLRSRSNQRIADNPGPYGFPNLAAAVLPGVSEVRHDRGHPCRVGPPARIEHQQQLHHVLIDRRPGRRNHVDVSTTQAGQPRPQLTVGEAVDLARRQL